MHPLPPAPGGAAGAPTAAPHVLPPPPVHLRGHVPTQVRRQEAGRGGVGGRLF